MMQQSPSPTRSLASVAQPVVRSARAEDRPLLRELIAKLSPESAYSRFLTGVSGEPSERVLAALLPEAPAG
jgi:hypothetical protein